MIFDHFAVSALTLDEAVSHVEESLGVKMGAGGQHAHFATHNRLIGLEDGLYLESIAADPTVPAPSYPRWFDLDVFKGGPRITNWICRVDDLESALEGLPKGAGDPVALTRGDLRWKMAVPANGKLPCDGAFPALIQWQVENLPGLSLPSAGLRLMRLEIAHPEAKWLSETVPLNDPRVVFVSGDFDMQATFDGPNGTRVLR
ncbi:VOC family protein [uncultured Shimia sp.]|uniref:VOC family protein n=1 Tax=uncultured Shimia sp. TaxID=573152 RepID=UPI00262D53E8|nr:VOC family protein [uncultured Shimia sp.]